MDSTSPHNQEEPGLSPNNLKSFETSVRAALNGRTDRDMEEALVSIQLLHAGWNKGGITVIREEILDSNLEDIRAEHCPIAALNEPFTPPSSTSPIKRTLDKLVAAMQAKEERLGLGYILADPCLTNIFTPSSSISPTRSLSHKLVALPHPKEERLSPEEHSATPPDYITEDDERVLNFVKGIESVSPVEGEPPHLAHSCDFKRSSVHESFHATVSSQESVKGADSTESVSSCESCPSCETGCEKIYFQTTKKTGLDLTFIARLENLDDTADWTLLRALGDVANVAIAEQDDPKTNLTFDKVERYRFTVKQPEEILRKSISNSAAKLWKEKVPNLRAQYKLKGHKGVPKQAFKDLRAQCQQEAEQAHPKSEAVEEHDRQVQKYQETEALFAQFESRHQPQQGQPMNPTPFPIASITAQQRAAAQLKAHDGQRASLCDLKRKKALKQALNVDLQQMAQLMENVPKRKAATSQLIMTREDVERKMQEQNRRCGFPVTALGDVPGSPSTWDREEHAFSTPSMNHTKKHKHSQTPYRRPFSSPEPKAVDPEETNEYDSDQTIPETNHSDPDSNSNMPPTEKKNKQAQFHYNGPQVWMLDEHRTDPIAVAAKNDRSEDLNNLIPRSTWMDRTPMNANRPSSISESNIRDSRTPNPRSVMPHAKPPVGLNNSNIVHLRGGYLATLEPEQDEIYNLSEGYERAKAIRKVKDDEEMYQGLQKFKGRQRGWNGERESDRLNTLSEYHAEQDRLFLEQYRNAQADKVPKVVATPKGKELATLRKRLYTEYVDSNYTGMTQEAKINAIGKDLEDGYTMLSEQSKRADADFKAFMEENNRVTKAKMMGRPWDLDTTKREALEDRRARPDKEKRKAAKKGVAKKSLIIRLPISCSSTLKLSQKRAREDDEEVSDAKRARVE